MKDDWKYLAGIRPIGWLRTALYGVILYFVYHSALELSILQMADGGFYLLLYNPLHSSLYHLGKEARTGSCGVAPSWMGLVPLALGIVFYWLGELGGEFTLLFLSLWLVIVSLCWLQLGWQKLKIISFPLVFGLASFVPPNALYAPITLKMKMISTQIGVKMMQFYGLSAYREGNVIDLGFTQLQVVDACSGLRYVIPLLMMGVLLAYYFKAAWWKKIVLVLSTIPLSIITNSLRIASVGVFYQFMGQAAAEGFFHDFSGWFIFMASLAFLLLEMWVLKKVMKAGDGRQETKGSGQLTVDSGQEVEGSSQEAKGRRQETETGVRRLEAVGRSRKAGDRGQLTVDRRRKTGGRR